MVLSNNSSLFTSTIAAVNPSLSACIACSLLDFVIIIQSQVQFSTIFTLKGNVSSRQIDEHIKILSSLGVPSVQFTSSEHFEIKDVFRSDILAIVYLELDSYEEVFNSLAKTFNRLAQTRILFVCIGMTHIISDFLRQSWKSKMINSVAFIAGTSTYVSYTPFPEFQTSQHSVYHHREVFPYRMMNIQGYPFRIATDGIEPRDFFYINRQGKECIGGYTASLVQAFARKINATLTMPLGIQTNVTYHTDLDVLIETDVVDIFIGLAILSYTIKGESYAAEITDWCVMLPVESVLPVYLYFPMIFGSLSFVLMFSMVVVFSVTVNCFLWMEDMVKLSLYSLFLKENCLRALFGQSPSTSVDFSMKVRTIYFLSYVLGLFFNTWYLATLDMLYTSPPTEKPIRTIDDLYRAPLKVLIYRAEYLEVLKITDEYNNYLDTLLITDEHDWYHAKRNELNRSFAYPVPMNKWKMFEEQQSLYKTPVFRRSDICIARYTLMVFLLHENSVFTEEMNKVILQSHQSGLFDFWVRRSVLELIEAGRIKLIPESDAKRRHQVTVYDLQGIFIMFGVLTVISCMVFVAENVVHRFMSK